MKGLIYKDFLLMRKYAKLLIIYFLLVGTFCMIPSIITDDVPFYGVLISVFFIHLSATISSMFIVTSFEHDDASGWMKQVLTCHSRKQYLGAKYLFHLLAGGLCVLLSTAMLLAAVLLSGEIGSPYVLKSLLFSALGGMEIVLYMGAVMIPLLVKFGAAKGKFLWIPVFLPVLAILLFAATMKMHFLAAVFLPFTVVLLLFPIAVIFGVMLVLGLRWVGKKEL